MKFLDRIDVSNIFESVIVVLWYYGFFWSVIYCVVVDIDILYKVYVILYLRKELFVFCICC